MALEAIQYVQRSEEGEPYLDAVYRALTPPMKTSTFHSPNEYIHMSWDEVLSIASDEWTPLSATIGRMADAADIVYNWPEQRSPKSPGLSFLVEGADPAAGNAVTPVRYYNAMGTQGKAFKMTDEAQIIARAGGLIAVGPDEFARQLAEKLNELVRDQELALLESHYNDATEPRSFRGILGNYRNADGTGVALNGWIGGVETATTLDFAGAEVTAANAEALFDKYLLQLRLLQGGGLPTTVYVAPRMMKLLKDAASTKIQVTMTQDEVGRAVERNLGGQVGKIITSFGILNIIAHPMMEVRNAADDTRLAYSRMLFLDPRQLKMVDYKGYGGVHLEVRAKTDATETRLIKQIYTLQVRKLLSHGVIKNFWVAPQ
jgi:hypothetical protein